MNQIYNKLKYFNDIKSTNLLIKAVKFKSKM